MNYSDFMASIETHVMFGVLLRCNLLLAALMFIYSQTAASHDNREYLIKATKTRLGFCAAFLLLLLQNTLPYHFSAIAGNCFLFAGYYADTALLLSFITNKVIKTVKHILLSACIAGAAVYALMSVSVSREAINSMIASLVLVTVYGVTAAALIIFGNCRFKRITGVIFALFLIGALPRIYIPFRQSGVLIRDIMFANGCYYLALVYITICGAASVLLLTMQKNDSKPADSAGTEEGAGKTKSAVPAGINPARYADEAQTSLNDAKSSLLNRGKVLVVDDTESNQYVTAGILSSYGLETETVSSGFDAIKLVEEGKTYDIIFMDYIMPEMDGIRTVKLIRDMGYTLPVIALTANIEADPEEMFITNGFDGFLAKPIDTRRTEMVLNKYIRSKKDQDAHVHASAHSSSARDVAPGPLHEAVVRDAEKAIAAIETLLHGSNKHSENDIRTFTVKVHAMKSALTNIGEGALSKEAAVLEKAGLTGDIPTIMTEAPVFCRSLRTVIKKITPKIETVAEDTPEAKEFLIEKLLAIKEFCETYNITAADKALNELRKRVWSAETSEIIKKTGENLLRGDYDEQIKLVSDYIKNAEI